MQPNNESEVDGGYKEYANDNDFENEFDDEYAGPIADWGFLIPEEGSEPEQQPGKENKKQKKRRKEKKAKDVTDDGEEPFEEERQSSLPSLPSLPPI